MRILGIIPARYASSRLPGKALKLIGDKSMIRHVYEQCIRAGSLEKVIVATDHPDIEREVRSFGGEVMLTSEDHPSGTDRCEEVAEKEGNGFDFVINIQGDEPFIDPEQIDLLAKTCTPQTELATLVRRIEDLGDLFNRNVVKVVLTLDGRALYFSRSAIPAFRDLPETRWLQEHPYWRHIGMYAYRTDILKEITRLPLGVLEQAESLEQLRWLENGYQVFTAETDHQATGIDTPEDLERVRKMYQIRNS